MFFKNLIAKLQGKTTMFLISFFITGHILQFIHKLDATYITFFSMFMSIVLGHSYKDDKHEQSMAQINGTPTPAQTIPPGN